MKYCTQCNKQFETHGSFCPKCGNKLAEVERTMYCPNCGKQVATGISFCDSCGAKLDNDSTSTSYMVVNPEMKMQRQQNNRRYLFAGVAVLIIALLGGSGYFWLKRQNDTVAEPAYSNSTNSESSIKLMNLLPEPLLNILGIKKQEIETAKKPEQQSDAAVQKIPSQTQTGNVIPVVPPPPVSPQPPVPPVNGKSGFNRGNSSAYIRGTDVRIRTGPGLTYDIMGHFNNGEQVMIVEVLEGWYKVRRTDNSVGYVSSQFCIRN